jgi:hypothetical protein
VRRALETIAEAADLADLTSHDFRRSLASFLIVAVRADVGGDGIEPPTPCV